MNNGFTTAKISPSVRFTPSVNHRTNTLGDSFIQGASAMQEEIWKPVVGYEGLYDVSNTGRIRTYYQHSRGRKIKDTPQRIVKQSRGDFGYLLFKLAKNGNSSTQKIHRIVLTAFVGPCPPGMECLHLDGNSSNNNLSNLKWGTHTENMSLVKSGAKITPEDVIKIRKYRTSGLSYPAIARLFPISRHEISYIVRGLRWQSVV